MRRSVLVTGASSGIGLATALHLADLGFATFGSARTAEGADVLHEAAGRAGVDVEPLVFDVADPAACEAAVAGLQLYGLVNNAGYFNAGAIEDVTPQEAIGQLQAMVVGPMHLARLALPSMRAAGQGRIVNVTSAITYASGALTGWYQATKQALAAASEALRMEIAGFGVEVVQVEPGAIDTRIWQRADDDLTRRRVGSAHAAAYHRALAILRALEGHMHPPQAVAAVIGGALTAGRPRPRYRVGAEAFALSAAGALTPARARDRLVRTALRL